MILRSEEEKRSIELNIGVIGIGGVGGYFGGKIAHAMKDNPSWNVYFIARGPHLEAIQSEGLVLDSDEGVLVCNPTASFGSISDLPKLDFCIICVKGYDLNSVLEKLQSKIVDSTIVLPLLNGVDIYDRIRAVLRVGTVLPACAYVGTHIERPGLVKQRGGACTIHLGNDPEATSENRSILSIFNQANIKYVWHTDPFIEIWSKFTFIASSGLVTANHACTFGELLQSEDLVKLTGEIASEVISLSKAKGIGLPGTILEDTLSKMKKFPADTKTSFQRDFENPEKSDERDLFGGSILRLGKELGISTERTNEIYKSINKKKPIEVP